MQFLERPWRLNSDGSGRWPSVRRFGGTSLYGRPRRVQPIVVEISGATAAPNDRRPQKAAVMIKMRKNSFTPLISGASGAGLSDFVRFPFAYPVFVEQH